MKKNTALCRLGLPLLEGSIVHLDNYSYVIERGN